MISPGAIDTPGLQGLSQRNSDGLSELYRDRVPLGADSGHADRPEDIASAVSFLASDDSSYVAGTELFVDSGLAQA